MLNSLPPTPSSSSHPRGLRQRHSPLRAWSLRLRTPRVRRSREGCRRVTPSAARSSTGTSGSAPCSNSWGDSRRRVIVRRRLQRFLVNGPVRRAARGPRARFESACGLPRSTLYRDDPALGPPHQLFAGLDLLRRDAALAPRRWWCSCHSGGHSRTGGREPISPGRWSTTAWTSTADSRRTRARCSRSRATLAGADLVLASAAALEVQLGSQFEGAPPPQRLRVPALLRTPSPYSRGSTRLVGYYGAISDWFDSRLVGELAARNPDWRFVLVGSTFGTLGSLDRGGRTSSLSARLVRRVCDGSSSWTSASSRLRRTPLARRATDPVKVYEMLAGGKPVVSTSLPEIVALGSLVRVAEDVAGFEEDTHGPSGMTERRVDAAPSRPSRPAASLRADGAGGEAAFPRLSVVVVTHNNADLTARCLRAWTRHAEWPNLEVVVADNESQRREPGLLTRWASGRSLTTLQLNAENLGFAAANNRGLAVTSGEFLPA